MATMQCDPRGKAKCFESELKNSESFQETIECSVCNIILNSFRNLQTHSISLEHVQKVIAENSENSESLEVFRRINHFSKFEDSSSNENVHDGVNDNILPRMKNVTPEKNSGVNLNTPPFSCSPSEKSKSGQIPFMQHMESEIRKEKKTDTEAKNDINLSDCDLEDLECNTRGNGKEYDDEDFRQFHCIVCNEDSVGYHSYLCHSKGSIHAKNLDKCKLKAQMKGMHYIDEEYDNEDFREFHCIVCNEDSVGYHSYLCHSKGSVHAKNLEEYKLKAQMKGMHYIDEEYENEDFREFHCIVCNEDSVGYHSYLCHSKGSIHAKNLEEYKLKAQMKGMHYIDEEYDNEDFREFHCIVCNEDSVGYHSYLCHSKGSIHAKNLEKYKLKGQMKGMHYIDEEYDNEDFREFHCIVCNEDSVGYHSYLCHSKGSIHAKNLEKYNLKAQMKGMHYIDEEYDDEDFREFHCIVCNEDSVGYHSYLCHLKGSVHAKNLEEYKLKAQMKGMHYIDEEYDNEDFREFHCIVCNEDSVGYHSYLCHSKGSIHAKNLEKYKLKGQMKGMHYIDEEYDNEDFREFHCIVCNEDSVGYHSYLCHSKGSIHAKNLEKYNLKALMKGMHYIDEEYDDEDFREFHCIVCNEDSVGYHSYLCHSKGSIHAKNLEKYKLKAQMKGMHYIDEEYDDEDFREFHCIVCNEDSVGYHSYLCHSKGSVHAKNLKKYKLKAQK